MAAAVQGYSRLKPTDRTEGLDPLRRELVHFRQSV